MKQYKIVKTTAKLLIGLSVICLFVAVFSSGFRLKADTTLPDNIKSSDITNIGSVLDRGLEFLEYFLGTIAFIAVLISGIQFGMSGGDPTAAAKAKKSLIYSVIGIVLSVLAFAITKAAFGLLK